MASLPSPERCQAIAYRLACCDFPWDVTRALELALFRTFASPAIAGVLHATGEFERRAQRRYDDTDLIVATIIENGFDSDLGKRAIARMNAIHGRFRIANEDFLYVLSTFVFEPLRWLDRFGWRVGRLTLVAMRLRAATLRLLPKRRRPRLRTALAHRSYPNGWQIEELGPPKTRP